MRAWRAILAATVVLTAAPFAVFEVYLLASLATYGKPTLPPDPPLHGPIKLAVWAEAGERGEFTVTPLVFGNPFNRLTNGNQAAFVIAKHQIKATPPRSTNLPFVATWTMTVWLTRHWSADDMTRAIACWDQIGARSVELFGKPPDELDLAQAALAAALYNAPPYALYVREHPDSTLKQRNRLLDRMLAAGLIEPEEHDDAVSQPLGLSN